MTWAPPSGSTAPAPLATPPRRFVLVQVGAPTPTARPPLELCTLAAGLRALAGADGEGVEVQVLDLRLAEWEPADAARRLADLRPDALVLWAEAGTATDLMVLVQRLRAAHPAVAIVAGGRTPLERPGELLAPGCADLIARPGEESGIVDWLRARRAGRTEPAGCRGLLWRAPSGELVREAAAVLPRDAEAVPAPAWDLSPLDEYARRAGRGSRARERWAPLQTSWACAADCPLCRNAYGRVVRGKSPERVLSEIELLVRTHGVRELVLEDELPNYDPERLRAIARGIAELRAQPGVELSLSLTHPLRADRVDVLDAYWLARAGVRRCAVLVGSGSQRMQRATKLNLDLRAAERGAEALEAAGIATRGVFTLGLPGESEDERRATVRFATRAPFATVQFSDRLDAAPVERGLRVSDLAPAARGRRRALLRAWLHAPRLVRVARLFWLQSAARLHRRAPVSGAAR